MASLGRESRMFRLKMMSTGISGIDPIPFSIVALRKRNIPSVRSFTPSDVLTFTVGTLALVQPLPPWSLDWMCRTADEASPTAHLPAPVPDSGIRSDATRVAR